jgi:hypothetical protein
MENEIMDNEEIFKPIEGFENYAVSNFGNVKNIKKNKNMSIWKNSNSYLYVSLYNNKIQKKFRVSRLVAKHFLIKDNENKNDVDHIDKNRGNNHISNLRWLTHRENILHKFNKYNEN